MQIYEQFFFKDQCSANLSLFCTVWFIGVCEWQQSLIIRVPVCLFAHKKILYSRTCRFYDHNNHSLYVRVLDHV